MIASSITAKALKDRQNEFVVIDVREAEELSKGKIDVSIHMPLGAVIRSARTGKLEHLKGKKIVTHCGTGYRGNIAADELNKAGFEAFNLEGGFKAWTENK
ncbi:MAG: rhodanese-like domain-containing protein [Nitrososphaerales archaeon]